MEALMFSNASKRYEYTVCNLYPPREAYQIGGQGTGLESWWIVDGAGGGVGGHEGCLFDWVKLVS